MEIFKVAVSFDDNGNIFIADGLKYQDFVWIVPKWLTYPTEGKRKPERIIRLQNEETQHSPNSSICLYSAKHPLPATLLTALNQSQIPEGYAVQFLPDLAFAIQS